MERKRLKIGMFVDSYYPIIDGVHHVVDNYAKILSQRHDVTVFVPRSVDKKYIDEFPYKVVRCKIAPIRVGEYSLSLPNFDAKFKQEIESEKFDIIHIHSPFSVGRFGIEYANKNNIPVVITCHSQFYMDFKRVTGSRLVSKMLIGYVAGAFNSCNELWTMNKKLKQLVRDYGYKGKVFIIPNGSDMNTYNIDEQKVAEFKSKFVSGDEKLIINVGRIFALKNIGFILKVCSKLKEINFKFKMVLVGTGCEIEKYKKMSKKLGLDDVVKFVGVVKDREELKYYYAAADLFFFPSAYDTDGLVKSEAACFGTPTIFLEGTIASSVAKDGYNGYIGEANAEKFAKKIISVFSDPKKYNEVCENAKKTLFIDWNSVIDLAEEEYYKVIERGAKKPTQKEHHTMEKKYKRGEKINKKLQKSSKKIIKMR